MADLCDLAFSLCWEELQVQLAALTQASILAGQPLPDYEASHEAFLVDLAAEPERGTAIDVEQMDLRRALGVA